MTPQKRRLLRQFTALERRVPALSGPIHALLRGRWFLLRLPLAILLIMGGLLSFLPVLGIWMLPLGLLLLAVDVPVVRTPVSVAVIRARRRFATLRRRVGRDPSR